MAGNKTAVLWTVNVVSATLFIILALTGLINWLVLPQGGHGATGLLVGFRHFLRNIHEWTGLLFIAVVGVHVALHRAYISANLKRSGLTR